MVLLDHAAKRRDFRNARYGLKLILQEPVLQAAQLTEVMLAGPVDQSVEIDPTHASGIRTKLWARTIRQRGRYLRKVLQHTGARPVGIGVFVENHIDVGVAEEGVAAYRYCPGNRQHGRGERVGDLIFDDLRSLARVVGLDDHLHI